MMRWNLEKGETATEIYDVPKKMQKTNLNVYSRHKDGFGAIGHVDDCYKDALFHLELRYGFRTPLWAMGEGSLNADREKYIEFCKHLKTIRPYWDMVSPCLNNSQLSIKIAKPDVADGVPWDPPKP